MNARIRLSICLSIGIVTFIIAFIFSEWQVAILIGWDATAASFIAIVFFTTRGKDASACHKAATSEDDSRTAAEAILVGASVFSLVAVALALIAAGSTHGLVKSLITTLVVVSVLLSWASVHAVFTLRYARIYYAEGGGISFHSEAKPDFGDFLYVSLTLGMTYQVSDTDISSKAIRMTVLRHGLLSYLFGVVVVATTINVVATLLTK
jgi:uncharacterized membrane protein